ncbi:flagellar motor protein MotB [Telmatobacter sp. DSM 110680]|uniref:Flagellar motor protein MotB n=1 Tax=Telmatobacter sp. DSM 110680 TaxID=3036704 RepID=A0AAU7DGH1_9BACT
MNHERWLVSYADFITLLFAFFVVLYAFSKADQKKHAQVSAAIDSGFQSLSIAATLPRSRTSFESNKSYVFADPFQFAVQVNSDVEVRTNLESIRRDLQKRLSGQLARGTVSIQLGRGGLVVSLREAGFFDSGSAIPRPETMGTLHQISESLENCHYDLRIEGHTDTIPIHTPEFDSNWELSSSRATHIARLLLQMDAISPQQISAAGYAEYHPVVSNDSIEGRAQNRRVDIVVMPRAVLDISSDDAEDKSSWRKLTSQ